MNDVECVNARRAAAAIALEAERARAAELEQQSEAKRLALREREAQRAAEEQDAAISARLAAEAEYEARWPDPAGPRVPGAPEPSSAPSFGAPLGQKMPSMSDSPLFDVYADGSDPLRRPRITLETVEPPANDLQVASPQLDVQELAVIPRPFRSETAQQ